jgi:hypothetical protein
MEGHRLSQSPNSSNVFQFSVKLAFAQNQASLDTMTGFGVGRFVAGFGVGLRIKGTQYVGLASQIQYQSSFEHIIWKVAYLGVGRSVGLFVGLFVGFGVANSTGGAVYTGGSVGANSTGGNVNGALVTGAAVTGDRVGDVVIGAIVVGEGVLT